MRGNCYFSAGWIVDPQETALWRGVLRIQHILCQLHQDGFSVDFDYGALRPEGAIAVGPTDNDGRASG
jgi:hypothetical protein